MPPAREGDTVAPAREGDTVAPAREGDKGATEPQHPHQGPTWTAEDHLTSIQVGTSFTAS